ncbi:hypothetical protein PCURB6_37960 [Paenibacillus curdlanolyticus]|nr:hypothetical protein PCURB6_37960 [Paenibacillus curdlanolyticus]
MLGGGEDYWFPTGHSGAFEDESAEDPSENSKGTQGNLVAKAQSLGYSYVTNKSDMQKATGKLLGLFANEEMFQQNPEGEGDLYNPVVSLPDMTKKAIETLSSNPNGFFLIVEEEATDEMAHRWVLHRASRQQGRIRRRDFRRGRAILYREVRPEIYN